MSTNVLATPMYRVNKEEDFDQLLEIVKNHVPTLRQYELIDEATAYLLQSEDGTLVETFEWKDEKAKQIAHEHPAIRTIWGKMQEICSFPSLKELPESNHPFPNFKILLKH